MPSHKKWSVNLYLTRYFEIVLYPDEKVVLWRRNYVTAGSEFDDEHPRSHIWANFSR